MTSRRNAKPRPRLESTTPAVCNAGVTVELEPSGVSGSGREVKLLSYSYSCVAALQVYWYGNTTYTELTICGYTLKTIPKQVDYFYFCNSVSRSPTHDHILRCVYKEMSVAVIPQEYIIM